ncbi:MAG: GDP-L-fucose synthase [Bacteriovoracaceae bacterium]|nr:GDP-L-fucose synthase [Bacteriovoracaceae bacterium]
MPKDLLTGSEGLVGSAIKRHSSKERDLVCVTKKQVDLTDFSATVKMMEDLRPERVFHAAAAVGGLGGNMRHPGELFRKNILINFNVLEAARVTGVKRVLSYLSTCIFPDKVEYPMKETSLHEGPPHPSNFGYAHAKRMIDIQSRAYRMEYGCDFITAVGTNLFGLNDNFNLLDGHALPSLIHKTYLAKRDGKDLTVWGSGKPLREFVFADDIARLSLWAMDEYHEETPLMFSHGEETSIRELVELIAKKMNFQGKIIFDDSKADGQYRKPSDVSKLKKFQPDFKFTSLEKAIEQTTKWFTASYPNIRM